MKNNISYGELVCCQDYADRVMRFYRACNLGELPATAGEAELAVREYNSDFTRFKHLYGFSIRGYIETIVDIIGATIAEQ